MWLADTPSAARAEATPGARGSCPSCRDVVIAKCGEIVARHWAHESREECDAWSEPDSVWHRAWQLEFPRAWCEVAVGPHRADVKRPDGLVIEFQHSHISTEEIRERERFYGRMIWVFDAISAKLTERLSIRLPRHCVSGCAPCWEPWHRVVDVAKAETGYRTFRWKHPRTSLAACGRMVFLDVGGQVLSLRKFAVGPPCGGWGFARDPTFFVDRLRTPL